MPSLDRTTGLSAFSRFRALFVVSLLFLGSLGKIGSYFLFQPPSLQQLTVVKRQVATVEAQGRSMQVHMRYEHEPYRYPVDWPDAIALELMRKTDPNARAQLWVDRGRTIWQVVVNDQHLISYDETSRFVREHRWKELGIGGLLLVAAVAGGIWVWWRDWRWT